MKPKIILLPGNGEASPTRDHWFPWLIQELQKLNLEVVARDMPDPEIARMAIWLPFIKAELKANQDSIIIGHSSGGVAALRYLESHRLFGAILVGVNHTDLGYPEEKEAGWYDAPWQWAKIKQNAGFISQFASTDDPFIPIKEQRFIAQKVSADYHEFTDRGHFMLSDNPKNSQFPELHTIIKQHTTT
jgi:hypothetical protein